LTVATESSPLERLKAVLAEVATGSDIDPEPYLKYLHAKFA
jgi:hypothetical protein